MRVRLHGSRQENRDERKSRERERCMSGERQREEDRELVQPVIDDFKQSALLRLQIVPARHAAIHPSAI